LVVLFLVGSFCSLFLVFFFWFSGALVLLVLLGFCVLALIVPAYVGAPYALLNKIFLLIKNKIKTILFY
jgi:hypothetical protein